MAVLPPGDVSPLFAFHTLPDDMEAFLGAQEEWRTSTCRRRALSTMGQPELPKKAERVYGKPGGRSDWALS
ncbi:hypothetical protein NXC14_PA00439 (plasmid) [Rhizobium sp. NXC14]|nr:hypothetical protein NXC14_PA00439 [Rhizobium sp. NXC14]